MLRTCVLLCSVSPIFLLENCISSSLTGVITSDSCILKIQTSELGYPNHWQQTLKNRTCIVPKQAYAGSSTQWLTAMHEMRSDESSLILSCLWPQSHGRRAACSLMLWGCSVTSLEDLGCVNTFPGHIHPENHRDYTTYVQARFCKGL